MLRVSGSKSQPGSGVPAAAVANKSDNVVNAPSVTLGQKSGPSAALKVVGSHSSKATTCAGLAEVSPLWADAAFAWGWLWANGCVAPPGIKLTVRATTKNVARRLIVRVFILVLLRVFRNCARESAAGMRPESLPVLAFERITSRY